MPTETNIQELLLNDDRISFSFLVSDISRLMRQAFDEKMATLGLTRSQWHALVYVLSIEKLTQTELAGHLDIGRAAAGLLVDQLEKSGFINRTADPKDRRVWRIESTKQAFGRAEEIAEHAESLVKSVFESIGDKDLALAHHLLETLRENLNNPLLKSSAPDR
jgi:DNA-binding MarR family transcriptional regulator